jgi:hypothetical protein
MSDLEKRRIIKEAMKLVDKIDRLLRSVDRRVDAKRKDKRREIKGSES